MCQRRHRFCLAVPWLGNRSFPATPSLEQRGGGLALLHVGLLGGLAGLVEGRRVLFLVVAVERVGELGELLVDGGVNVGVDGVVGRREARLPDDGVVAEAGGAASVNIYILVMQITQPASYHFGQMNLPE